MILEAFRSAAFKNCNNHYVIGDAVSLNQSLHHTQSKEG